MAGRQASCPECGASIDIYHNEDGDILNCPDCDESLELIDNGDEDPELIYNY